MDKLIDWITGLPKFVQILLALSVIGLLSFVVFKFAFGSKEDTQVVQQEQVLLEVPDASLDNKEVSRMDAYRRESLQSEMSASDFWNQLDKNDGGGLLVDSSTSEPTKSEAKDEYLDPSKYSELEIYYIRNGVKTKAEIDAQHIEDEREEKARQAAEAARQRERESANSDSAYFARMERAYQLALKYNGANPQEGDEQDDKSESSPETRRIEIPEPSYIPDNMLSNDGIISSLEQESVGLVYSDGKTKIYPAKATFLKSEKVVGGQRVIMRLKEEMRLSDGTTIPANTHISGICKVGSRLEISINAINYGGRIYRTDMSVYDSDGTEGIYCPVIEQKKGRKSAGKIAGQATSGLASVAASLFTGNPYVGRIASSSINELSRTTLNDGSVAINIVAGYDFYIFENVEDNG